MRLEIILTLLLLRKIDCNDKLPEIKPGIIKPDGGNQKWHRHHQVQQGEIDRRNPSCRP
jgi:hypothetical protein